MIYIVVYPPYLQLDILKNCQEYTQIMELILTNLVHDFNKMIYSFIETKHIDPAKVQEIDEYILQIRLCKQATIRPNMNRRDIVKIFSGINLIENFLVKSKEHLLEGIERKENPKSAKDIFEFESEMVELANKIDAYTIKPVGDLSNSINSTSIYLRERLRANELYPSINEGLNPRDKATKEIAQSLVKGIGI